MKNLKTTAIASALLVIVSACDQKRNNATLGGTKDTVAVTGSAGKGAVKAIDTNKMDTTNKGNVNPSGHRANDTPKNPH